MTNKEFQKQAIIKYLRSYGVPSDIIDLTAEIDATLNLSENFNIIKEKYNLESLKLMESLKI